jgi:hypothetical protein
MGKGIWLSRAILETSHKISFQLRPRIGWQAKMLFNARHAYLELKALVDLILLKFRKLSVDAIDFCGEVLICFSEHRACVDCEIGKFLVDGSKVDFEHSLNGLFNFLQIIFVHMRKL